MCNTFAINTYQVLQIDSDLELYAPGTAVGILEMTWFGHIYDAFRLLLTCAADVWVTGDEGTRYLLAVELRSVSVGMHAAKLMHVRPLFHRRQQRQCGMFQYVSRRF